MTFALLARGQVWLAEWTEPLAIEHVVNLLIDLREARQGLRTPPLLVLAVRPGVFTRGGPFDAVPAALPALLDCCSGLFLVVENRDPYALAIRAQFAGRGGGAAKSVPQIFGSLDDALVAAQAVAPHDALELQRQTLRRQCRS